MTLEISEHPEEKGVPALKGLEEALEAAFGPSEPPASAGSSVLSAIQTQGCAAPRVTLRDADLPAAGAIAPPALCGSPGELDQLGRYQVQGEIARGGMGIVWKAHDVDLGRDVAVKVLHERHLSNPTLLERFVEEAQIGGQLQHPGVVPVHELGIKDRKPYFSMKLVRGVTLASMLSSRPSLQHDHRRFISIFEQVAQTMAYAHSRGVIHRDLKPANVLVGAFGEVQVVDWGLAKVLRSDGDGGESKEAARRRPADALEPAIEPLKGGSSKGPHSVTGSVIGTPAYMPPEQASGLIEQVDERSDVFSLGAILCEILTGSPPYTAPGQSGLLALAQEGRIGDAFRRLESSPADPELIELAKQCLEPRAAGRPRNAQAVADRIGRHLASVEERAQTARIAAAEERGKAAAARKSQRLTAALALSVLATLSLAGGGYLWVERDRAARNLQATHAVTESLQEAERLHGEAKSSPGNVAVWTRAAAAARKAEALLDSGDVGEELRRRTRSLASELSAGEREAERVAARRERDEDLRRKLEGVVHFHEADESYPRNETASAARKAQDFEALFSTLGLEANDPKLSREALQGFKESAIARDIAAALDDWALAKRKSGDAGWTQIVGMSREIDPDPLRDELRSLLLSSAVSPDALKVILARGSLSTLPPPTLLLAAKALEDLDAHFDAVDTLRKAQIVYPGEASLSFELALTLEDDPKPDWGEIVRFFTAARAARPQSGETLHRLGQALQRAGNLSGAAEVFLEAIRLEPRRAHWHWHLGSAYLHSGKDEAALEAFREAVRLDPGSSFHRVGLATACYNLGRLDEALESINECLRLEPRDAGSHAMLGAILRKKGELDAALESCNTAIRLDPKNPEGHRWLGAVLLSRGETEKGLKSLEERLRLEPTSAVAHYELGTNLDQQGRADAAIEHYREAIRLRPDFATALCNLGLALKEKGQYREAVELLEKCHAAGAREPHWKYPSAEWLEEARRLAK